jgi:hypothetical protein
VVRVVITFLALLALIALGGAVTLMAALIRTPDATDWAPRPYVNPLAASVAIVATLGSLFMSEIAGFIPCRLCWVQRGFMYPLALVFVFRGRLRISSRWLMTWPWPVRSFPPITMPKNTFQLWQDRVSAHQSYRAVSSGSSGSAS